jgi:acetyl esterase
VSPEAKFPVPLEDCWSAFDWVRNDIAEFNGDPDRIAVGGDSAGGNLAAALSFLARDRAPGTITYQMLIYPVTDISNFDTDSYRTVGEGFFLTRDDMIWFAEAYTHDPEERKNPLVSPLLQDDLHGLPPAHVVTCGYDPLRDEGQEYAKRLRQAGVPVTEVCYEDQIHGFIALGGVIPAASGAIEAAAAQLRDVL